MVLAVIFQKELWSSAGETARSSCSLDCEPLASSLLSRRVLDVICDDFIIDVLIS